MLREAVGQPPAKLLGVTALCAGLGAWAAGDETLLAGLVVSATAGAGVYVAGRVAVHRVGSGTAAGKAAMALSAVAGGFAGAAFAAGNEAAVAGVESGVAVAALTLCAARVLATCKREDGPEWIGTAALLASIAAGVIGWSTMGFVMPRELSATRTEGASDSFLMARHAGSLVEALSVELSKEILGGCGTVVDRKGLTFDDRIKSALKALIPYVAACTLINGVVAPTLLASGPGSSSADGIGENTATQDLIVPVLVTCVTNMLRNGFNTAAVIHTWEGGRRDGVAQNPFEHVSAPKGATARAASIADRAAIRIMLMAARTTTYVFMRAQGFSIEASAMAAQAKYALFTQFREVIADVMAGEGWSAEVLARLRATDPPSRIDLEDLYAQDIEAPFDAAAVERDMALAAQAIIPVPQ